MTKTEKDASLLRQAWEGANTVRVTKGMARLSRKELANETHVTPGLVSHYMRGREPLNVKWQLRFASYLGIAPASIWPDFQYKNLAPGDLPPRVVDLAFDLLELEKDDLDAVRSLVQSITKKRA